MKVAFAADHAGFLLKEALRDYVQQQLGHSPLDLGAFQPMAADDYPDYAEVLGRAVNDHMAERGILICGSGVGASIAANKIPNIRAGLCHDTYSAHQGVEHDSMNVLVLGSRVIGVELAKELVRVFLAATFSGEPRHERRLGKVKLLEEKYFK